MPDTLATPFNLSQLCPHTVHTKLGLMPDPKQETLTSMSLTLQLGWQLGDVLQESSPTITKQ